MPNWCENYAVFHHEREDMLDRLVRAFNSGNTMQEFLPCPQELIDTTAGRLGDPVAQAALEERERKNVEKYDAPNWYEWNIQNWGTKWDFGYDHHGMRKKVKVKQKQGFAVVELGFDTAWNPPLEFYEHMRDTLGFEIEAYYFEPGMGFLGSFLGNAVSGNDYPITIENFTEEWLRHNVPEKICKVFNLYEQAAQQEADEREYEERQRQIENEQQTEPKAESAE